MPMNSHPRGHEEQYLKSIELSLHLWFISVDSENMSSVVHMDFSIYTNPFQQMKRGEAS